MVCVQKVDLWASTWITKNDILVLLQPVKWYTFGRKIEKKEWISKGAWKREMSIVDQQ